MVQYRHGTNKNYGYVWDVSAAPMMAGGTGGAPCATPAPPCAPRYPLLHLHRHLHVAIVVHSLTNLCNPLCKHGV